MADVLRLQGAEVTLNNSVANTVGGASLVRVIEAGVANNLGVVTVYFSGNSSTNATMTIVGGQTVFLKKAPTDTLLSSGANTKASPVKTL
jgi:hypothetical protein